jgi:hypothetical protein
MANHHKTGTPKERAKLRLQEWQNEGRALAARGSRLGNYLAGMTEEDMRNLHQAKDDFDGMLDRAHETPQMITIEGRRGEPDRSVFLLPLSEAEAFVQEILDVLKADDPELQSELDQS